MAKQEPDQNQDRNRNAKKPQQQISHGGSFPLKDPGPCNWHAVVAGPQCSPALNDCRTPRLEYGFRPGGHPEKTYKTSVLSDWSTEEGNLCPTLPFSGSVGISRHERRERRHAVLGLLYWALVFLLISLVAALFGFSGIAAAFGGIAQLLFYIFVALFIVTLIVHLVRGRGPPPVT